MWKKFLEILGVSTAARDKPAPILPPETPKIESSEAREKLLARIGDINDFDRPRPIVTLAEFFEGNDDWSSIGYNLENPPSPQEWYQLLQTIRKRPEVYDIRIEVKDLEQPDAWPATDTIWFITTASPEQVRGWFPAQLVPDEIIEGLETSPEPIEHYEIPAGYHAIGMFYD